MSNKVDPKRAKVFIAVFATLAIVLDACWEACVRRQQPPQFGIERQAVAPVPQAGGQRSAAPSIAQEQQANQRAEEAAAARATYLARYVNSAPSRQPGMKTVAVAVVSENGAFNFAVNAAVASRLKTASVATLTSFFRPAFVSDGLFANAFAGSNGIFDKLELSKSLDVLLLGREQVQYSSDPSLENVTTANIQLELTAFSIADGQSQSWTFVANGAGFKRTEARQMADERLIKQIANDTKMSLSF
jgi:hypothetical protein